MALLLHAEPDAVQGDRAAVHHRSGRGVGRRQLLTARGDRAIDLDRHRAVPPTLTDLRKLGRLLTRLHAHERAGQLTVTGLRAALGPPTAAHAPAVTVHLQPSNETELRW